MKTSLFILRVFLVKAIAVNCIGDYWPSSLAKICPKYTAAPKLVQKGMLQRANNGTVIQNTMAGQYVLVLVYFVNQSFHNFHYAALSCVICPQVHHPMISSA